MKNARKDMERERIHFIDLWARDHNISGAAMARALGVHESTVSRWFKQSLPEETHLRAIAALFGTDTGALFRDPADDWLIRFFAHAGHEKRMKAIRVLKAAEIIDPDADRNGDNDDGPPEPAE